MKLPIRIAVIILMLLTTACADLSYYLQSASGQLSIISNSRDINDLLEDETTQDKLREKLMLIDDIRQFAFQQLQLPQSDSYTQYADIQRPYVIRNLFAADEFSMTLEHWCYPIAGCTSYRGYFDESQLMQFKSELENSGKDVYVANIPAYSTLGWFDDPVLNTFINWPDYRLAGLIFHELAHQKLYIDNDSNFNEAFAMAVQQTGVEKWLNANKGENRVKRYRQYLKNRQSVIDLIESTRTQLSALYEQKMPDSQKRVQKKQVLNQLKVDYQRLSGSFKISDGFGNWFRSGLNNAKLSSVSTYNSSIPAFKKLLKSVNGDYAKFYTRVEKIGSLTKSIRQICLQNWINKAENPKSCN